MSGWAKLTDRIVDHLQGIEDLKEKLRKVFWLQLDYYERHEGLGRIVFMTLPMKTWMADETFDQPRMMNLLITVLRQGQKEGILNTDVRAGTLLDFLMGFVQRSFFMWILRGQERKLGRTGECHVRDGMAGHGQPSKEQQEQRNRSVNLGSGVLLHG